MKVLILNPPYVKDFCRSARWAARSRGRVQRHPDWLLIAAGVLERAGHSVKFIDGPVHQLSKEEVAREIEVFLPELVVIHTTTPSIYNDIAYAALAKEKAPKALTVLVGPHATALPEETLGLAGKAVDAIAVGEYDYTLRDIAGGMPLREVKGLCYWRDGKASYTSQRSDLDVNELPFPAWHHIRPEWYHDAGKKHPFITLISGRGCFGTCTFCRDTQNMYGRKLRLRNPSLVVDEIEYDLKLFPYLQEIMFETDTFVASRDHVEGICEEMLGRDVNISWSCNVRVDMDLDLLPLMKRAGCRMLMTGFEFGTDEALRAVKKGATVEQSRRFAEKAHRLGFIIHGCFMIGAPGETRESARKTIEFAKSLPLDTIQISGICAYPGTEIYRWAKENGHLLPKDWTEWVDENGEQVTILNYPNFPKEEMDAVIDEGLREFYLRPGQMLRMLASIRDIGDLKRKVYGLASFFDYFTAATKNK